jgi:hypothetical protein
LINIENNFEINEKYNAQWFDLNDFPELIFDYNLMVNHAVARLRYRASTQPIGFELLPDKFTIENYKAFTKLFLMKLMTREILSVKLIVWIS